MRDGVEILPPIFSARQIADFSARLKTETELAAQWAADNQYAVSSPPKIGCELECCLVDGAFLPAPLAEEFIRAAGDPSVTFELGRFNAEFNLPPAVLRGAAFGKMERAMRACLRRAGTAARALGAKVYAGGILPTLSPADFVSAMITAKPRYAMLERQLRIMKNGRPFAVDLGYNDSVQFAVNSAAIEAAATSFQVHVEIPGGESAAFYNAAQAACAPMIAACANAPFFMGRKLWAETRVPLFEQILFERFAGRKKTSGGRRRKDIFGANYLRGSAAELFSLNLSHFPPLLPLAQKSPPQKMRHLSFHNGTIWRWNRPVLGFGKNGAPGLRIEHRPLPSGPSCADMAANIALFTGLVYGLRETFSPQELKRGGAALPFETARANFYAAARDGMDAGLTWFNGKKTTARKLILKEILPAAARGLKCLPELDAEDGEKYLDIIRARAAKNQNGAQWQSRYIAKHGGGTAGMARLAAAYHRRQQSNRPVHEWDV
ncbi:MAG: glutamate--cysteine ligase [Gammaproteobacteria bacterium]